MRSLTAFTLTFIALFLAVYVLIAAKAFFVPLVIAIVIWYFIITIVDGFKKISFQGVVFPTPLAYLGAFAILSLAVWIVLTLVINNVYAFIEFAPFYQEKMQSFLTNIYTYIGIEYLPDLGQYFKKFDFVSIGSQVVFFLTDIAGNAGMITVYVIFLLVEHCFFEEKLTALLEDGDRRSKTRQLFNRIAAQIKSYLRIKTFTSFLTAFLSFTVMILVGVNFPGFWAFLIFLLNFIPTIGSIIATIFPCLLALLQFETWTPFIVVVTCLISIQFFVGNILEPRVMGRSLNLSGLVIILSLTIWGAIWGVVGMFLCVPIMAITSIILANFPKTRFIAVLLSVDGQVEQGEAESP